MNKNTHMISLVVIGVGVIAAVATGMQSRNASSVPKDAITASGTAQGMDGPVTVELALSQDTIYSVTVTDANETPEIGTKAIDALPGEIVSANSLDVDAVSGATITSNAIKEAAAQAITEAGFDPAAFGYAGEEKATEAETEGTEEETETEAVAGDAAQKAHDAAVGRLSGASGYLNRYSADATTAEEGESEAAAETENTTEAAEGDAAQKAHDAATGNVEGAAGYLNRYSTEA
ncbi:MAG TPA: hypothetical protein DIW34_08255 [Oribacterium sp.]|nr:hypothetical protein [Oribacterium sp.]